MKCDKRPNILLITTDQQRGDCLGVDGHPVLKTPYLDALATTGIRFRRAYSTCPVCVPARRTIMTGRTESSHGVLTNYDTWLEAETLPGCLGKAGYQTHLAGKLHLWPPRKLYGFDSADWADSPHRSPVLSDYDRFLRRQGILTPDAGMAHGSDQNGWVARPFHLPEHLHFTNWCVDRAIEFLERRDPTVPFFLNVSFHQPHQPCTPPQCHWDRYINADLPKPTVGDWVEGFEKKTEGAPVGAWRSRLDKEDMRRFRAGYYGSISHIDEQVGRLFYHLPANTVILFISDHGEMLGDHHWFRKTNAFEGSVRIPFLIKFPAGMELPYGLVKNDLVTLADVMPTVLELAGVSCPVEVDGSSILSLLKTDPSANSWRDYVHGECALVPIINSGMQFITNGVWKYIWYPGTGKQQLFHIVQDPIEKTDLSEMEEHKLRILKFRKLLVEELKERPEGFTDGSDLKIIGGPTAPCLPGCERKPYTRPHPYKLGTSITFG